MSVVLTITAADGAKSTITMPAPTVNSAFPDGSANAPASTGNPLYTTINTPVQGLPFSTFLARYGNNRPSWNVAGIDYPVGIRPAALPLKDPATISMAGVSVSTANHRVTINSSNVTLQGYDFSLANGWQIQFGSTGLSNITVEDCYFKVGSNFSTSTHGTIFANGANPVNLTLQYCVFDANGQNINTGSAGNVQINLGSATVQYCYFLNGCSELMVFGPSTTTMTSLVVQYNVLGPCYGQKYGNHGDTIQIYGPSSVNITDMRFNFNTVFVDDNTTAWANQGFSLMSANQAEPTCQSCEVNNNTFCCTANATAGMNNAILLQISWISGSYSVQNNYIDPLTLNAGAAGRSNQVNAWITYNDNGTGVGQRNPPYTPTATVHGNVNLQTGAALPGG